MSKGGRSAQLFFLPIQDKLPSFPPRGLCFAPRTVRAPVTRIVQLHSSAYSRTRLLLCLPTDLFPYAVIWEGSWLFDGRRPIATYKRLHFFRVSRVGTRAESTNRIRFRQTAMYLTCSNPSPPSFIPFDSHRGLPTALLPVILFQSLPASIHSFLNPHTRRKTGFQNVFRY